MPSQLARHSYTYNHIVPSNPLMNIAFLVNSDILLLNTVFKISESTTLVNS